LLAFVIDSMFSLREDKKLASFIVSIHSVKAGVNC